MSRARDRADGKITGNVVPAANETYSLGSTSARFNDGFFSASTVDIGGLKISKDTNGDAEFKDSSGAFKKIIANEIQLGTGTDKVVVKRNSTTGAVQFNTSDGSSETVDAAGGGSSVTVSDTAPASPSAGDLWYSSADLKMYIYYNDGSSSQWVQASGGGSSSSGIDLTDLSVGAEATAAGDGGISYNNSTGVFNYTPPVIGGSTTIYANTSNLPSTAAATTGDMAFVTANLRFYVFNGTAWYSVALTNTAPTVTGANASYTLSTSGTATVVTLSASDPDGDTLTFSHTATGLGSEATIVQGTGSNTNVFTVTPSTTEAHAGSFSVTFTATDGANVVNNTSSFTLQFTTPQHSSTQFHMKTSKNNGRTNSVFDDGSTGNHTITPTGEVYQTTRSPYSSPTGHWSYVFSGSNYIRATDCEALGSSDFTIEFFVKGNNTSGFKTMFESRSTSGSGANGFGIGVTSSNVLYLYHTGFNYNSNLVMPRNEWNHIALVGDGTANTVSYYLNGLYIGAWSIDYNFTSTQFTIGTDIDGGTDNYIGRISNVRVSNLKRYTSGFKVPSSPFTTDSYTKVLTCQDIILKENSGNTRTWVKTGALSIEANAPSSFTVPDIWKPEKGGSAYFDGTDFVQASHASEFNPASSDWTVEMWLYRTGTGTTTYSDGAIFSTATPTNCHGILITDRNGVFGIVMGAGSSWTYNVTTSVAVDLNTWQHIALVREGTNVKLYNNGVLANTTAVSTSAFTSTTQKMNVGGQNAPYAQYFKGYIADFNWVLGTAKYTGNFTPPTSLVSNHSNTKLKLNFDQAGVFDSVSRTQLSLIGSGMQESNAQTKYSTTNLRLAVGNSRYGFIENLDPPRTGDFQVETWLYLDSSQTVGTDAGAGIFRLFSNSAGDSSTHNGVSMMLLSNTLHLNLDNGTGNFPSTGDLISRATWHHLVYLRRNGKIYIFLNGTEIYSVANTIEFTGTTGYLGTFYNYTGHCIDGYLEDFRYLRDHTTYPNERPQKALTAVSGTTLQLANASTIPSSPNGLTLTASEGSPTVSTFTPSYSDVTHSIYYDGNDVTQIAANTNIHFGTGDFTIEGHFWIESLTGTYNVLFDTRSANNSSGFGFSYTSSNMYIYSAAYIIQNIPYEYKTWMHMVYQRKTIGGTSTHQVFRDGVLVGEGTTARNYASNPLWIGGGLGGTSENGRIYVSDFRVIKGTAIYNKSFTPPTASL